MKNEPRIVMPLQFPSEVFDEYRDTGLRLMRLAQDDHWTEFSSACTNVAWRYRACWDHAESYKACYTTLGPIEAVYQTERHYFGTYTNGLSAIESMLYSLHALLASSKLLGWPFSETERKKRLPNYALGRIENEPQVKRRFANIHQVLRELIDCRYWLVCKERRNRMYHRSRIPRHLAIGDGPPRFRLPATSSTEKDPADLASIETLVDWLSDKIRELSMAGLAAVATCQEGQLLNSH